jgi:hypothetical protein
VENIKQMRLVISAKGGLKMISGYTCRTFGHEIVNTYSIEGIEDSFEINDAKYCVRCGEINPKIRKSFKPTNFLVF